MTSRGYIVDMISSIGDKICLTDHIEEQLRACENPNEKEDLKKILDRVLYLRRKEMSSLLEYSENPNPLYHCSFKHALGSAMRDVEVWEATGNEKDLERCIESMNLLAMVTSKYLGMEFVECARCLNETFLVEQYEQNQNMLDLEKEGDENV